MDRSLLSRAGSKRDSRSPPRSDHSLVDHRGRGRYRWLRRGRGRGGTVGSGVAVGAAGGSVETMVMVAVGCVDMLATVSGVLPTTRLPAGMKPPYIGKRMETTAIMIAMMVPKLDP